MVASTGMASGLFDATAMAQWLSSLETYMGGGLMRLST